MPSNGSNTDPPKKRSRKKKRLKLKSKSKQPITDGSETNNSMKNALSSNRCDANKLTSGNLSSLRWDNTITDPILENDRIEHYKELRRQRYTDARQQAIQTLLNQMQITTVNVSEK